MLYVTSFHPVLDGQIKPNTFTCHPAAFAGNGVCTRAIVPREMLIQGATNE